MDAVSTPLSTRQWHARIWTLAWPIIVSNLSIPLAGVVDTAVVGRLPDPVYIGGVAIGALIFSTLYWGFGFLRMGTTGFVAQCYGNGELEELHDTAARAIWLSVALGVAIVLVHRPLETLIFWLLEGSEAVEAAAIDYYRIRIWAAPAGLLNFAVMGILFGIQRMKTALVIQLVLNGMNMLLDWWFVIDLKWGIEGVAIATAISELCAAALGLWVTHRHLTRFGTSVRWHKLMDKARLAPLIEANVNIMLRTLAALFAFVYFTAVGARFGDVILAANAVLMHLFTFLSLGLDGFAHTVEALGGSAYGRRDLKAFRASVKISTQWAVIVAIAFTVAFWLGGPLFIDTITNIEPVRVATREYLWWMIALPIISIWSFQLDGLFIGATHTREMRDGMLISLLLFLVVVWVVEPLWGNHGLWVALVVFMIARALTLWVWYPRIERQIKDHH